MCTETHLSSYKMAVIIIIIIITIIITTRV